MKTLLLLRHGKSSWSDESLADHDRPLKKRGRESAKRMGQLLREKNLLPDHVLTSSAARATATTQLATQAAKYDGEIEVVRGGTSVAVISDPGAVFGEMSVLLDLPHTATVRARTKVAVRAPEDAATFLRQHPEIAFYLARLLAQRLNAATTYLVDVKRQYEGHGDHLGMVGEVLEALTVQQIREFTPGPDRADDPRM